MAVTNHKGKEISVHADGHIFVDGKDTRLKQWDWQVPIYLDTQLIKNL